MSNENKEDKTNEKEIDNKDKDKIDKKPLVLKIKLEKKKENKEDDEINKKFQRAQRFGLTEKKSDNNDIKISTEEELNKRKERFKNEIEAIEDDEKEKKNEKDKSKGERGRIRYKNNFKKNNYRNNYDGYRKSYREYKRGGSGRFHERRIRGDRRNDSYRK